MTHPSLTPPTVKILHAGSMLIFPQAISRLNDLAVYRESAAEKEDAWAIPRSS